MSASAFRPIFRRTSPIITLLSLAVAAVACAAFGQTASPSAASPTMVVAAGTAAAPVTAAPVVTTPAAPAPAPEAAAAPAATAPTSLVPMPGRGGTTAAPAPSPTVEVGTITQPFVATVTGDKVYVRSGPDTKFYEIGQVYKNDLVYVVGVNKGWYQILPPNGAYCLVAREFVDLDAGGAAGTIKGDPVNVRAGSAIYQESDYAILPPPLKKGTKVKVVGTTDKYYEIAPPEKAYFYVNTQYVKAAPGTEYRVAQLKLPPGVAGPGGVTAVAPTTVPAVATGATERGPGTVAPAGGGGASGTAVPPVPAAVSYSEVALAKYKDAFARYQDEAKKDDPAQQNVEPILKDFEDVLAMDNISPAVKRGCELNIAAIKRTLTVQRLIKDQATSVADFKAKSGALRQEQDAAERAVTQALLAGPFTAEGLLQTSDVVVGKYALVNPKTQRVVAYVDPKTASIDVGMFVGKYIGVRGASQKMEGSEINVIQVNNATAMPQPK